MKIREFSVCIWIDGYLKFVSFGIKSRFEFLARRKAIRRLTRGYSLPYCGRVQADESKILKITLTEITKE